MKKFGIFLTLISLVAVYWFSKPNKDSQQRVTIDSQTQHPIEHQGQDNNFPNTPTHSVKDKCQPLLFVSSINVEQRFNPYLPSVISLVEYYQQQGVKNENILAAMQSVSIFEKYEFDDSYFDSIELSKQLNDKSNNAMSLPFDEDSSDSIDAFKQQVISGAIEANTEYAISPFQTASALDLVLMYAPEDQKEQIVQQLIAKGANIPESTVLLTIRGLHPEALLDSFIDNYSGKSDSILFVAITEGNDKILSNIVKKLSSNSKEIDDALLKLLEINLNISDYTEDQAFTAKRYLNQKLNILQENGFYIAHQDTLDVLYEFEHIDNTIKESLAATFIPEKANTPAPHSQLIQDIELLVKAYEKWPQFEFAIERKCSSSKVGRIYLKDLDHNNFLDLLVKVNDLTHDEAMQYLSTFSPAYASAYFVDIQINRQQVEQHIEELFTSFNLIGIKELIKQDQSLYLGSEIEQLAVLTQLVFTAGVFKDVPLANEIKQMVENTSSITLNIHDLAVLTLNSENSAYLFTLFNNNAVTNDQALEHALLLAYFQNNHSFIREVLNCPLADKLNFLGIEPPLHKSDFNRD